MENNMIPHEVVIRIVDGALPVQAWREYLNLTQDEAAERMGVSQSAFAELESVSKPRKETREQIAAAFGINADQLEL